MDVESYEASFVLNTASVHTIATFGWYTQHLRRLDLDISILKL